MHLYNVVEGFAFLWLVGIGVATAVRRRPPGLAWRLVPGLACAAASLATSGWAADGLPMAPVHAAWRIASWSAATTAPVAIALSFRRGAARRPASRLAWVEVVLVCVAFVEMWFIGHGIRGTAPWLASAPGLAVIGSLRSSDELQRVRAEAAALQLASAWATAGLVVSHVARDLALDIGDASLLVLAMPALVVGLAGCFAAGLPSRGVHRALLVVPVAATAVTVLALLATEPTLRLGSDRARLATREAGSSKLDRRHCLASADRPPCPPGADVAWVGPADAPLPAELADSDPGTLWLALRVGDQVRVHPLWVPGRVDDYGMLGPTGAAWSMDGRPAGIVVDRVPQGGFRVGDEVLPDLAAAAAAAEAAVQRSVARCPFEPPAAVALAAGAGWTPSEVVALCPRICWWLPAEELAPPSGCFEERWR